MANISDFPDLDQLENRLAELFKDSVEFALEDIDDEDVQELSEEIRSIKLEEIIIFASWANDNAIKGETELNLGFILTVPDELIGDRDPSDIQDYLDVRDLFATIIDEFDIDWDLFNEWFDGFDIDIAFLSNRDDFISFKVNITDSVRAYSLTYDLYITIVEGEPEFPGGPVPQILEETEAGIREPTEAEPEEEEEIEPEEEEIEEEFEPPEIVEEEEIIEEEEIEEEPEEVIPDFPGVPDPLRQFAVSPDRIDVPTGKETKSVNPREIYDWERELASPQGDLDGGIGEAMRVGGEEDEDTFGMGIPPGTFPRTGAYIKYHLLYEGPSYVLEMYNDLIIYSAFISTVHEGSFKTGEYDSFRAFLNRVRLVGERGGPQLIEQLSQQQASALELETVPDHPYIEDGKAPWLERRIYYDIVEENVDNSIWYNITEAVSQLSSE